MTDVSETPLRRAYRLAVCRRCAMFEAGTNPEEVQRTPAELNSTGEPAYPDWVQMANALLRRGLGSELIPTDPDERADWRTRGVLLPAEKGE